jgi:hypothetical protein
MQTYCVLFNIFCCYYKYVYKLTNFLIYFNIIQKIMLCVIALTMSESSLKGDNVVFTHFDITNELYIYTCMVTVVHSLLTSYYIASLVSHFIFRSLNKAILIAEISPHFICETVESDFLMIFGIRVSTL